MATANVIGIPGDDKAFEEQCIPLFKNWLNDPNVKLLGTRGSGQSGLDLIGRRDRDPQQPVGVQCKLVSRGGKLTDKTVRQEVAMALSFRPALTEYYIVTTARDDLALESLALELSQEQAKLGRKIDIQVWGWDTLQQRIRNDPDALRAFDPNYSASTNELLALGTEAVVTQTIVVDQVSQTAQGVASIQQQLTALVLDTQKGAALEAHLDTQIDQYRDLLNEGKPRTALGLLDKLEATLPAGSSAAIRARIRANLGFAHLKLGDQSKAGALLEEAYVINPNDPKVKANRILALATAKGTATAFEFGREVLENDPSNAGAATMVFQIAADEKIADDPHDIVPEGLLEDLSVSISRLQYVRAGNDNEGWWALAADVLQRFPDDSAAKRYAGEALIDQAFVEGEISRGPGLAPRYRDMLQRGAQLTQDHWDTVRHYENASHEAWAVVGCNLISAYRALGEADAAKRTRDQLLSLGCHSPEVAVAAAHLATDENDETEVLRLMLPEPESSARTMLLLSAWSKAETWPEIIAFATAERRATLGSDEAQTFDVMLFRARYATEGDFQLDEEVGALLSAWPLSAAAHVIVADIYRRRSSEKFKAMTKKAKAILETNGSFADRVMFAQLSLLSDDWEGIIDALDGHVPTNHPNEPLEWLAVAFANTSVRPQTKSFFRSLPNELLRQNSYARLAGAAECSRGDLKAAETHLRNALADDPTDLRASLLLISAIERDNRPSDVRAILSDLKEAQLRGAALDKMRLAVLLRRYGFVERALAIGYETAATNRDNEEVVSCYPVLVFFDEALPDPIGKRGPVAKDFWVSLKGDGTADAAFVIDDINLAGVSSLPSGHPLATAALGKSIGEGFGIPAPFGPERSYAVEEIKHKFVWLLHDIMESHAARFPNDRSMFGMNVREENVQPVLSVVKDLEQHKNVILQLYRDHPIPAAALAAMAKQPAIIFAEHLASIGETFRTCIGSLEEREEAMAIVRDARGKGAVLDTTTYWVAYRTGVLPALKGYFGRVCLARSSVDELLEIRTKAEFNRGREYMTIGFEGDQPWKRIYSAEDTEAEIATLSEAIEAAQQQCEILPTDGTSNQRLEKIMRRIDAELIGEPINLARSHSLLLLSDDLPLRQIAAMEGVHQSAWLQPTVRVALEEGAISEDEYLRTVGALAALKHDHVSLDAPTLLALLTRTGFGKDWFQTATEFIGGEKAEMSSHLGVAISVMASAWASDLPFWFRGWACGRLLERLISNRDEWKIILQVVEQRLLQLAKADIAGALQAHEYFVGWMSGHFFNLDDIRAAKIDDLRPTQKLKDKVSKSRRGKRGKDS